MSDIAALATLVARKLAESMYDPPYDYMVCDVERVLRKCWLEELLEAVNAIDDWDIPVKEFEELRRVLLKFRAKVEEK